MVWNLSGSATEELQEEYEKLGRMRHDDTLGDTYQNVCQFKREEIGRELKKRNAHLPGAEKTAAEYCAKCGREMYGTERVFLHKGQTVCEDCIKGGDGL